MPIADPFEHRATRNARQPALRLCFEACPLIYDPLQYLDFKSPEVGTEEVSRGFPHGDFSGFLAWGTSTFTSEIGRGEKDDAIAHRYRERETRGVRR